MAIEKKQSKNDLLSLIRTGRPMATREQLRLTLMLSLPSIIAQVSSIAMQYIDAAMVGSLGAAASASIGLVSTTTWLFWGLCSSAGTGFSVQVAHHIGAGDNEKARTVLRQSFVATLSFSILLMLAGCAISRPLPGWLGGGSDIAANATSYFCIFALSLPIFQINHLAGGMLRCSGNMIVPGVLNAVMCLLDVVFNALLIFPTRTVHVASLSLTVPGAGWGVEGAAVGTLLAEAVTLTAMLSYLWFRSPELHLAHTSGSFRLRKDCLKRALHIGLPMGGEHAILCGAQILTTVIVAPLGTAAIAANAFAITAESLCYMPGYGIAEAATTLVGQSIGAKRRELTRRFARISVYAGMAIMSVMGGVMFLFAPQMMAFFTPDTAVRTLGVTALRTEAFAEPMFAASIVAYGVFVGAGDTLIPCCMNLLSIWAVRLTLAALLAPVFGLHGVWIAMCIELCFRGIIFLVRLYRERWIKTLA
ncbi:MAG: MATE family efflux transporter [Clostridium sp.]|nr:MATE family efflux transporter [Clostridium sp.]